MESILRLRARGFGAAFGGVQRIKGVFRVSTPCEVNITIF